MAQRTVCLCDGKYIGIETIYTVIKGRQINIPEKLRELRAKSQNNELFCPCGCGANLILVAGDRNLREQHFRLKDGSYENECHVATEGKTSVDSKIVLKCWLDEKLRTDDIETRVPVNIIGGTDRKYEFSFLSRSKKVAISYCHESLPGTMLLCARNVVENCERKVAGTEILWGVAITPSAGIPEK